jgi:DHA2 family multidrug resistance protein
VMLVTGAAQLMIAPVAVALETRVDARYLTGFGFAVLAVGLAMSTVQTPQTDYDEMFWPQVVRGTAFMFCLLPPTRLALGQLDLAKVPDASGLFNLMRNLGGAIGLALIDTVIYTRTPRIGETIMERLAAGDIDTARSIGVPLDLFKDHPPGPISAETMQILEPLVKVAAQARSINEAWMLIAVLTALALICVPFARPVR